MNWLHAHISGLIDFGFGMVVVAYISYSLRSQFRKRRHFFGIASQALGDHSAALRTFVESRDAPRNLKSALLTFSEAISHKQGYDVIVEALSSGGGDSDEPDARDLKGEISALEETHPELAKAFWRAIVTGAVYSVARWQYATEAGIIHASVELADRDKKMKVVSKMADSHPWPLHPSSVTA